MIFTLETIIIGRILFGISVGSFSVTIPRYLEETLPSYHFDSFAPFVFTFSQAAASLAAYKFSEIIPEKELEDS